MRLKVVDDLGDGGFGGHWGIAICEDDGFETGDYLGQSRSGEYLAAVAAAKSFAMDDGFGYQAFADGFGLALAFSSRKKAQNAVAAARRALKGTVKP